MRKKMVQKKSYALKKDNLPISCLVNTFYSHFFIGHVDSPFLIF